MSSASQNRSLSGAPSSPSDDRRVTVVLGPTNTGKTHLALERMTGYGSGMIGFPLRLLARENYDRLVACLLYTSPSPRDVVPSRMPSSA